MGTKGIGGHCQGDPLSKSLDLQPSRRMDSWLMAWYRWSSPLAYRSCLKGPGERGAVFAPRWFFFVSILEIGVAELVALLDCTTELCLKGPKLGFEFKVSYAS